MSVFVLVKGSNLKYDIFPLIDICKSSSMVMGILMRAGLCYGSGITDKLEELGASVTIIFINDDIISTEDLETITGKEIIIVDAVINSGQSVFTLLNQLPENSRNSAILATTVIPSSSVKLFNNFKLFTVRISENKYQGAKVNHISNGKGPDTGDRLFNTY